MILGLGIDIIEVARVRAVLEKFGDRFSQRVLRPDEIAYCRQHRDPAPYIAARFAAKEAISKAFGTGLGRPLSWQDLEIARKPSGEPFVLLHGKAVDLLRARGGRTVHVSISHTEHYAAVVAILEGGL